MTDPHLVYYERSIHRNGTIFTERRNTKREKNLTVQKILGSRQDRTRNMYETLPSERGLGIIFTAAENCSNNKKTVLPKRYGPHRLLAKGYRLVVDGELE